MLGKGIRSKAMAVVLCGLGLAGVSASAAQADVRINDVSVLEGTSATNTSAVFTISRTQTGKVESFLARTKDLSASVSHAARPPVDYTSQEKAIRFEAGETSKTFAVEVVADGVFEANETFGVELAIGPGDFPVRFADDTGVGTILNDDAAVAINDVSVTEGNSGSKLATFTITRTGPLSRSSTVDWSTADLLGFSNAPATAGSDYAATNGTASFAVGQTSTTVSVPVLGDALAERDERFEVRLTSAAGAWITDGSGIGTIVNDDTSVAINDVSVTEGNSGTKLATFTIERYGVMAGNAQVYWDTVDGSATIAGNDYVPAFGLVYFVAGETSKQVSVTVPGDTLPEADETFSVQLSEPTGATLGDATGVGTITDDDNGISVNDVRVTEGNSGTTKQMTFQISRPSTGSAKTVSWATADGTAEYKPDQDYVQGSGTVSFATSETSKNVSVTVNGDFDPELDETLKVNLSGLSNVPIADGLGVGTIVNDERVVTIDNVSVTEGNAGKKSATFTISRLGPASGPASVSWATADETARADSDYTAVPSTVVTFAAGERTKYASVAILGDTLLEPDETFKVTLASPVNTMIAHPTGIGSIVNDDTGLSIDDVSVTEGNSGATLATFTITRSGSTTGTSSVMWSTANGTASAGSDYTAVSNAVVSFAAGETSKQVSVTVAADTLIEPDEKFNVNLSAPSGAEITAATGVGTIVSDDLPGLSINDVSLTEGNSGTRPATFTITRTDTSLASSVSWAALSGSAVKGDFDVMARGTVDFAVGEASKTVAVAVNGDTRIEPNETFSVNLSSPFQATIVDGTGVATIVNDD
jgi:chitinase